MPLSQAEAARLGQLLSREGLILDGSPNAPAIATGNAPFEQVAIAALTSLTNILTRVEIILETIGAGACEVPGTEATEKTERKPRGRKPKEAEAPKAEAAKADGDNPFDKPSEANGAGATKDNTGFAPSEEAEADPLGDKSEGISEADLKVLLKEYMGRFGDQGVPKVTALLSQFGVKRFQDLPKDKFDAVAVAARKEM